MQDEMKYLNNLPRTKIEAVKQGSSYYFTGEPCKHGHIDKRKVNGGCYTCWRRTVAGRDKVTGDKLLHLYETPEQTINRLTGDLAYVKNERDKAVSERDALRAENVMLKRQVRDLQHDVERYKDG